MARVISKIGSYTLSKVDNIYQVTNPDGSTIDFAFRANAELYATYNDHKLDYYDSIR